VSLSLGEQCKRGVAGAVRKSGVKRGKVVKKSGVSGEEKRGKR